MINEMEMALAEEEISKAGKHYKPSQAKRRSLGGAIFLAAIADYRGTDAQEHRSAKLFLYPQTRQWRRHHDWALELAEGMNPAWLREALDRFRSKWDGQRAQAIARERRRALKADRRNGLDEKQRDERIQSDGAVVSTKHGHAGFQPAGAACSARDGHVAAGL